MIRFWATTAMAEAEHESEKHMIGDPIFSVQKMMQALSFVNIRTLNPQRMGTCDQPPF